MKNFVDEKRNTIYIQSLDESISNDQLEILRGFAEKFYLGLKVKQ
jgi:hypothetical protein